MFRKKIARIVAFSREPHSRQDKLIILLLNELFFLLLSPWLLILPAHYLVAALPSGIRQYNSSALLQSLCVFIGFCGLGFSLWSVAAQWLAGRGTPSVKAPTQQLLTSGPYRWCRNPIQLGAVLYILGLGSWYDGVLTGALAATAGLLVGILYLVRIEEKELEIRFGQSYLEYKRKTPFFIPFGKLRSKSGS